MLNPFFLNGKNTEQSLVQDLINEQLRMYGVETYYLPREFASTNTILREVIQSKFTNAFPIEMYVDSYEGYGGQGTILSKFGIQNIDELTLVMSRERYENYIAPQIGSLSNMGVTARPKEGDLIYFPLGDRIFEITYVEHEQPFYQLQKNYTYTLKCQLFEYEDEVIDTGIPEIDQEIEQIGYIQTLTLVGAGRTATATASICASGSVRSVTITNMGGNYSTQPIIGFSSAPEGGVTAVGVASITNQYYNCNGALGGKILAINLTNAGCGYTTPPWVTIQGGGGTGAKAEVSGITTGAVQIIEITDGGAGYSTNPNVTFVGGGSTGPSMGSTEYTWDSTDATFDDDSYLPVGFATAKAYGIINNAGVVTSIVIEDSGSGYTNAPFIYIDPPTTGIGSTGVQVGVGTYVFNEVVIGDTSGTEARVKTWNEITNQLEISIVTGDFTPGELIIGQDSGAKFIVGVTTEYDLVTPYADNDTFEEEAKGVLDFSEDNPFGMP